MYDLGVTESSLEALRDHGKTILGLNFSISLYLRLLGMGRSARGKIIDFKCWVSLNQSIAFAIHVYLEDQLQLISFVHVLLTPTFLVASGVSFFCPWQE